MCPLSVNDVIQDALKSELRNNNEILLLNNGQNNNELNPTENETYDSDDSNAYVRRRVAELNLELSKEKEYFADSYEKKTGRVNFHPQLFYSRIISQDSCEDLNDFSEDEMNELTKLSHNDGDTVSKPIMNANLRHSQQRTSVIPGPVNITENNLGRQASLILKENNVEEPDRNSTDNVNITRTDDVTKKKKHRTASINEQDNNVTKIITKHVSNQNNERIRNSQSQYSNDKPLTEKEKENSIQIADKNRSDQKVSNWLRAKVLQRKGEEEMKRYENEEQQYLNVVHSREACEQAFKQ
uniref:Pre-mRNA-splicing factor SYF2 n=1 Tax=Schistosoma mansoni TaxID=6183 RepID=A0A5K4F431_SCHMA